MSGVYARLNRMFASTQKATTAIINSSAQKTPNPTKEPPPTKAARFTRPKKTRIQSGGVRDLLNEKDSEKLLQKFTTLSENVVFRQQHYRIYEFTIHRLTLAKRFSLIEQALESQKKYIFGEGFAARLIYLYGKADMFDHAYKLFDELPERKCPRGTKSFNALLTAAANSQKFDKAYELFQELPPKLSIKPDVDSYNRVAYALCELGLLDKALSLLDEMETNGLSPDVVSFNTLMGAFYKKGDIEKGEKTWERMVKNGLVPDTHSYNFKLWGLVNEGKLTEAIELVEELKSKKLQADMNTYNSLIKGSCKNDDLEGAKRWYVELLKNSCVPNKVTFSILVPFLCEKGDYCFAFQVCERKFKKQCLVIDEALLQNVVDGLVKDSMTEEAETLVKLAKSSSYVPYNLAMPSTG